MHHCTTTHLIRSHVVATFGPPSRHPVSTYNVATRLCAMRDLAARSPEVVVGGAVRSAARSGVHSYILLLSLPPHGRLQLTPSSHPNQLAPLQRLEHILHPRIPLKLPFILLNRLSQCRELCFAVPALSALAPLFEERADDLRSCVDLGFRELGDWRRVRPVAKVLELLGLAFRQLSVRTSPSGWYSRGRPSRGSGRAQLHGYRSSGRCARRLPGTGG